MFEREHWASAAFYKTIIHLNRIRSALPSTQFHNLLVSVCYSILYAHDVILENVGAGLDTKQQNEYRLEEQN